MILPPFKDILLLPHSQSFAESLFNSILSRYKFKRSTQRHPQVDGSLPTLQPSFESKSSTFSTLPTGISSLLSILTLNPKIVSNHINSQHKKCHLLLSHLIKNQCSEENLIILKSPTTHQGSLHNPLTVPSSLQKPSLSIFNVNP